jgi:hypothetical protein
MMQIIIEQAYREACRSLGEALVREQLLRAEIERLTPPVETTE